jgi:rhamnogalacturonan endolyase
MGTDGAAGATGIGGTNSADGATSSGGAASSGGSSSGGIISSGGVTNTGGVSTKGGAITSGGATSFGGGSSSGGIISSGGVTNTGGVSTKGGAITSGGATSFGGTTGSGGLTVLGGVTNSGGVTNTGGVSKTGGATTSGGTTSTGGTSTGHFQMENLDRGLVAVKVATGVYVGWRMFGYEYNNSGSVAYDLYRDGSKLATVTDSTNYLDATGTATSTYTVAAAIDGAKGKPSSAATVWAQSYLSIPLQQPTSSPLGAVYIPNDASPGDLDGDGQLDLVLKWDPSDSKDNSLSGVTSNVILDGYSLAGKFLWRIDLGPNIRAGAHYTQFVVYDFDGDGRAEMAVKTAPGSKDGTGAYLHTGPASADDDSAVYRNANGYILTGPEYLTVFDGTTGAELATENFDVGRGTVSDWGDGYGNRVDRFLGSAAFVSDTGTGMAATGRPSILMARGYYTRATVTAWNWRDGKLSKVWRADSDAGTAYRGQGSHSMMVADADGDGAQEIIYGASTIASNGTAKCSTGFGHSDALHVGVFVPTRTGIQVFMPHEDGTQPSYDVHDAFTCEVIVRGPVTGSDNGRAAADFVSPTDAATCSSLAASVNCATGEPATPSAGFGSLIYWDADELRETQVGTSVTKPGGGTLMNCSGCGSSESAKVQPTLIADLLGDWREEIIWRETNNAGLRLYTTTDVTKRRIYTLMQDPQYRMQISAQQTGYNQPAHVGFHIGSGMADPPKPDIYVP